MAENKPLNVADRKNQAYGQLGLVRQNSDFHPATGQPGYITPFTNFSMFTTQVRAVVGKPVVNASLAVTHASEFVMNLVGTVLQMTHSFARTKEFAGRTAQSLGGVLYSAASFVLDTLQALLQLATQLLATVFYGVGVVGKGLKDAVTPAAAPSSPII